MAAADVSKEDGITFEQWKELVDKEYTTRLGMGSDDLGDAQWYDYYEGDMTPAEGMAHALVDWQDLPPELSLEDLGLGGLV